jgi:sec-independent protein translocase protein TatC
MLAVPVWLLYELGILVARVMLKNKRKEDDEESSDESNEDTPQLAAPVAAAALPAALAGELSADEASVAPPDDAAPAATDADDTLDMDAEFARAEEEERRLNAGEALEPSDTDHVTETQAQDDEPGLIHRDDRNTSLQEPSSSQESDDDAQPNKPNP